MKENIVSYWRMPSCAKIEKVIKCKKHGEIAATVTWNGNELTFFRTDFLDFERVAWYCAEKFSKHDYHERLPKEVEKSIKENGGFFLSKHFMKMDQSGHIMSAQGIPISMVNYMKAKELVQSMDVPGLETDLMYGVIYDMLGNWLIETETITDEEWLNSPMDEDGQNRILTRDCGGWTLKEILGNIFVREWTQERWGICEYVVTRSGVPCTDGEGEYPSRMRFAYHKNTYLNNTGIRAFCYFK